MRDEQNHNQRLVCDGNAWHVAFQTDFGLCHFMRFQSSIHIEDDVVEKLSLLQPIEHFDKLRFVRMFFSLHLSVHFSRICRIV